MDREKVINAIECCIDGCLCAECDYEGIEGCWNKVLLTDALALLKEQEADVRCKDCIYWKNEILRGNHPSWLPCMDVQTRSDFYCADGERKVVDG